MCSNQRYLLGFGTSSPRIIPRWCKFMFVLVARFYWNLLVTSAVSRALLTRIPPFFDEVLMQVMVGSVAIRHPQSALAADGLRSLGNALEQLQQSIPKGLWVDRSTKAIVSQSSDLFDLSSIQLQPLEIRYAIT